jgi:hypothetical protein
VQTIWRSWGHGARIGEMGNSDKVLVDKFERTRQLGAAKRKGQDNIKVNIKEIEY